jgi:putative membrane protein
MKNIFKIMTVALFLALNACNDSRKEADSNDVAEEANDRKFKDDQSKQDAEFVEEVVASNYAEIKLAELGKQRSRNSTVKEMAQMLLTDHSNSLNELKTLAQTKGISVPVEENDNAKRKIENFTGESGKDFDKNWCSEMIDQHEENIGKFEKRLDKTEDPELKTWIGKTLSVLRIHRDKLKACKDSIKDNNS